MNQTDRRHEIEQRLDLVRRRIGQACLDAGRSPDAVHLIVVTKTYPASDVAHLAELGATDVAENRDQEAAAKAAQLAAEGLRFNWHFIGRMQRNKCRSVVAYADVVHSVDNVALATALDRAAQRYRDRPLDTLVQVSLDGDPARGGAVDDASCEDRVRLDRVLETVAGSDTLRLRGLMAVAPLEWEPAAAFDRLAKLASRIQRDYPQAQWISAGMSGDLEAAVAHGSTHVRIGSAVLGKRARLE